MNWLLLVLTLPTENASSRMRSWRGLKSAGAVVLRDGVYLLPAGAARRTALGAVAEDVEASGGVTYLLELAETDYPFEGLFDRTAALGKIAAEADALSERIAPALLAEQTRQVRKLRKALDAVTAIDFFPGEAGRQTEALVARLEDRLKTAASGDEPSLQSGHVIRRAVTDFQARRWATRARPWVDRLASAWLIHRHIDPAARFVWLATTQDCPADALGFDFDGAAFTHVGERVTFEVLLASFGLESDPALARLGRIVHHLDAGGLPVPEATGLEILLTGMREAIPDDDALLAAASAAFDFFYLALKEPS